MKSKMPSVIMNSDTAEQSQTRLVQKDDSEVLESVNLLVDDKPISLKGISKYELQFCQISYRRQLMDVINLLSFRSVIEQPLFGFPRTLRRLNTTDSHNSGSVVFTVESRELLGSIVPSVPKYLVIKMSPHMLSQKNPGKGRFTDSENHLHVSDPPNIEAHIMLKIRRLIIKNMLPNVCLLYKYCVLSRWRVIDEGLPLAALEEWRRWWVQKPPLCRDSAVVMIVEHCRGGSLRQIAKSRALSLEEWKSLIWQLLYTLTVLNDEFPGFKHNDLHLGNVLIQQITPGGYWQYTYKDQSFYVPNFGMSLRLFDFDWSSAADFPNAKVHKSLHRRDVPSASGPNVFDVHYILNIIYSYKGVPEALCKWILKVYGKQGVKHTSNICLNRRLLKDMRDLERFPTPWKLMHDGFFNSFRQQPSMTFCCGSFSYQ